ncbi:Bud site selection protein bud4 [Coemansia sp. RSA 1933]|nr:Bud site selection protein bud4 [Coemansia sp. RSA 1933]
MKVPTHIDFSSSPQSSRQPRMSGSAPQHQRHSQYGHPGKPSEFKWPHMLYKQWFGAITEGRSIQVHSILADHPEVLNMRRHESTPFHMALTHIASESLGNDTTGMDGLQVAIMGYKNAYANWRLGNGAQTEQMASMSADQMKEHVAVREVILGALIDAISPEQLDTHFFGRQQNTTLHLAAFYNDANLVERLLRQGAAVDISNRMGFLPGGISNDKPTLQWLAMYQGQVRGSRYQTPPQATSMPQERSMHYYSPEEYPEGDQYMADTNTMDSMESSSMPVPDSPRTKAAAEEFNLSAYDQLSEDGGAVSESSYIKQFADSLRDMHPPTPEGSPERSEHSHTNDKFDSRNSDDDSSDGDQTDSGSVVSSSDRSSLGLGGGSNSKVNLSSKSFEAMPMRKRALENSLHNKETSNSRPNSRGSNVSNYLDKPDSLNSLHQPLSTTASNTSFHTAKDVAYSDGAVSPVTNAGFLNDHDTADDVQQQQQQQDHASSVSANSTMRLKEDLNSVDVSKLEDIFSDDDDDMVQLEPSYYRSGSGLSFNNVSASGVNDREASTNRASFISSDSSSASINMRSISNAMAMASLNSKTAAPASTAISAFPVMIRESAPRGIDDSGRPLKALEQLKQQEGGVAAKGEDQPKRASSPFLLRDSLYEMIMGKTTTSRQSSLASVGSANSLAYSNTSTVGGASKDNQTASGSMPISPTSPTSPNSHVSPTSTTFDGSSGSPSQTVISSPPYDSSFGTVSNPTPQVPDTAKEEGEDGDAKPGRGVDAMSRFRTQPNGRRPDFHASDHDESSHHRARGEERDAAAAAGFEADDGASTRSSSPVAAPRPTAASLFEIPADQSAEPRTGIMAPAAAADHPSDDDDSSASSSSEHESPEFHTPTAPDSSFRADEFPSLPAVDYNAGRIGRRQGRATAGLLGDEASGFSSDPSFSFVKQKMSMEHIEDKASRTDVSESELESPSTEQPNLPADVPLTRDKRDQYLQTLINRNTMRSGGSPGKRGTRSGIANAMRSNGMSDGVESSDDGDVDTGGARQAPLPFSRYGHSYKRSESALDFVYSRSPSALGVRDRSRETDLASRGSPSKHSRGASAAAGTALGSGGRMRSNTLANLTSDPAPHLPQVPQLPRPASAARKISPSLANLKTRSLVSNSPAKTSGSNTPEKTPTTSAYSTEPSLHGAAESSPSFYSQRIRAMSTPVDAAPPPVLALGKREDGAHLTKPLPGTSTARIGRVAALSQNFERQVGGASPPKLTISMRSVTQAIAEMESKDKGASGAASAPLGGLTRGFNKPAARSNSISSSHSAGGHGQSTTAGDSTGAQESQGGGGNERDVPESEHPGGADDHGTASGSGAGGGSGGGGRRGSNDDGDKPSPDPRAAILDSVGTDSNGSTSTHTTSSPVPGRGRGLAANLGDSPTMMLLDSRGSSDQIGSSIFSSTESKSSSSSKGEDAVLLHQSVPAQMPAARVEAKKADSESERKKRFRELANRRKSGTLERISNRGFVKSRRAFLTSSDSNIQASSPPSSGGSRSQGKSRKTKIQSTSSGSGPSSTDRRGAVQQQTPGGSRLKPGLKSVNDGDEQAVTISAEETTMSSSFLGRRGEEQPGSRESVATTRSANVDIGAPVVGSEDRLSRSHAAALPPPTERASAVAKDAEENRSDMSVAVASRDHQPLRAVVHGRTAQPESESGGALLLSRGSSGGRSGASGSGEDSSLHILSSLDTLSTTPESTPLDSAPENTNVGLLAQYNMNPKRFERRMKSGSSTVEEKHLYFTSDRDQQQKEKSEDVEQNNAGVTDVDLGFRTISDVEDDPYAMDPGDEAREPSVHLDGHGPGLSADEQQASDIESVGFHTLMPSRPRYNTKALFGLSTVEEEEEESRNTSIAISDIQQQQQSSAGDMDADEPYSQASKPDLSLEPESRDGSRRDMMDTLTTKERPPKARYGRGLRAVCAEIYNRNHPNSPLQSGFGSIEGGPSSSVDNEGEVSPKFSGFGMASSGSFILDDDTQSHAPSVGSNSYDPNVIFGYTSEENSTMASRSSFEHSDILGSSGRPGSSASHVIYMQPLSAPDSSESAGGHVGAPTSHRAGGPRWRPEKSSLSNLSFDKADDEASNSSGSGAVGKQRGKPAVDKGKGMDPMMRKLPEMEQIQPPVVASRPPHVTTVDELEADLSTDEEPIPKLLFLQSQDFEGYRPAGLEIRDFREEERKDKRRKREAAKRGITLPPEEPEKMVSPLWFMENSFIDPLTPKEMQRMLAERDKLMVGELRDNRTTEHPELKRGLESSASSISSLRLRQELDATMAEDGEQPQLSIGRGTIKPLSKRPRMAEIQAMFKEPGSEDIDGDSPSDGGSDSDDSVDATQQGQRQSFTDEAFVSPSDILFMPGAFDKSLPIGHPYRLFPRRRLVLRQRDPPFADSVMNVIDELDVKVRPEVMGTVSVRSAGQFAYGGGAPAGGTVRPSMIPQYVSPLNGVPAGPFFVPPKATAKSGYLYMRILSIEDIEAKTDSVYFVIRNGIDTLATTPVTVAGESGTTINQEFRILTDPSVSITMWMRFRSDAIIYRNGRRGGVDDPSCVPPLLKRLIRRNTRSRGNRRLNCSSSADSVFDFASGPPRAQPGAAVRRGWPGSRMMGAAVRTPLGPSYPHRVSSALMAQAAGHRYASERSGTQRGSSGYNDPRSLNATQAPSSVFYEPGSEMTGYLPSHKGLAHARFKEETRGVAVVHVGEMLDEVFLRGLVDSWDVENVWESRKGARLQLQLFYIPECPLFHEEELPRTLSECEMAMEVCNFHNRTLNSGYMSQRGGDTRFWRRRYFRLIGGFLFAYHEETMEPRCFIDLNDATRIVDNQATARAGRSAAGSPLVGSAQIFGSNELMRTARAQQRRMTHKRNNSDHSSRDGGAPAAAAVAAGAGGRSPRRFAQAPGHEYASDSEPAELVDIADPTLQRMSMRRGRSQQKKRMRGEMHNPREAAERTDSGIVSEHSGDGSADNGMQHSFSIEFGKGGSIEFYTETESEKRVWVEITKRVIGSIPKIPSWLIKLLHADVTDRIDSSTAIASEASIVNPSIPSAKFQDAAHPQQLAVR